MRHAMKSSDYSREENYNEFLRLSQSEDYSEVAYDEESGGVSAVHRLHKFDKQMGAGSLRRGDYERFVLDVVRKHGHRIILEAETNTPGIKSHDGFLDDVPMEIKAIEGTGAWSISTKLRHAENQHAKCVVLYFPEVDLFSEERILDGIRKYTTYPGSQQNVVRLLAVSKEGVLGSWDKKATPDEGWSIWEGFRKENGAGSYTLSPSDANIERID